MTAPAASHCFRRPWLAIRVLHRIRRAAGSIPAEGPKFAFPPFFVRSNKYLFNRARCKQIFNFKHIFYLKYSPCRSRRIQDIYFINISHLYSTDRIKISCLGQTAKFHTSSDVYISQNCSCASLSLYFCLCRAIRYHFDHNRICLH